MTSIPSVSRFCEDARGPTHLGFLRERRSRKRAFLKPLTARWTEKVWFL
jgi:hypothetical protein